MGSLFQQKKYQRELIQHYDELLSQNPKNSLVETFYDFILEEKFVALKKLRRLREIDIQSYFFAQTFKGI